MQFSTVFTALISLAAGGTSAIAIKARQDGDRIVGTVNLYNTDKCKGLQMSILVENIDNCITLEQGYKSASLDHPNSLGKLLATFGGKNCTESVHVTPPSACTSNADEETIWSFTAIDDPTLPPRPSA